MQYAMRKALQFLEITTLFSSVSGCYTIDKKYSGGVSPECVGPKLACVTAQGKPPHPFTQSRKNSACGLYGFQVLYGDFS